MAKTADSDISPDIAALSFEDALAELEKIVGDLERGKVKLDDAIAAYTRGIELVRTKPAEARTFMKGYTAIEGALTSEVPLASYMLYNEFKPSDVAYFQKFYDLFTEKGIFDKKVLVDGLLYKD